MLDDNAVILDVERRERDFVAHYRVCLELVKVAFGATVSRQVMVTVVLPSTS
ncbi:MAG: hypothetical protein ACLUSP_06095 [Christensenellales bacterium]